MKQAIKNKQFIFVTFFFIIVLPLRIAAKGGSSPNAFIENKGQILDQNYVANPDVLFMYIGNGMKVQLRKSGYSYELFKSESFSDLKGWGKSNASPELLKQAAVSLHRVDIDFLSSNQQIEIIRDGEQSLLLNYYINGADIHDVKSYTKVVYKNIYDKVDIEFLFNKGSFKYNIILNPGADIDDVKFICQGASSIYQKNENTLVYTTSLGPIEESIPYSYYSSTPDKNHKVSFKLNKNIISFASDQNKQEKLVIDPSTSLVWGTYFGGNAREYCTSNGIDATNNVYIAGYSLSTANIATAGVHQSTLTGSFDAYLSKFNSNGVQQWGTYFGGTSFDVFYAIHVMPSGIVFASGDTGSSSNIASGGAHQTTYGGGVDDAILVKFDANGQRLWSTYIGGNQHDISCAITVDSNGDAIITGHSESSTAIATSGAYSNFYSLNYDVFINKFNTNGVRIWGTYYGDTGADEAYGITTDASNNIYVTGFTNSAFNISSGGFQNFIGGSTDAFLAKFDPSGTNLIWATYYGGTGDEKGNALQCDVATGNIYLGANTTSSNSIASPGAYQAAIGSADDGFIAAFNSAGSRLWSTYYGGNDVDYINALVLDADKNILISGQTLSSNTMNSLGAYQNNLALSGFYDGFFAKFSNSGVRKLGTFFGGSDNENCTAICVDNLNKVYISGETSSTLSISTPGSHMQNYAGGVDAFLAKLCVAPEPIIAPSGTITTCVNNTYTFTASPGYPGYLWNTGGTNNPLAVNVGSVAGTFYFGVTATDSDGCSGTSDSSIVIVNLCTGIEEKRSDGFISVYPNPAKETLTLRLDIGNEPVGNIELFSVMGESILKGEVNETVHTINIKELASGVYFLRCDSEGKSLMKKIVVE